MLKLFFAVVVGAHFAEEEDALSLIQHRSQPITTSGNQYQEWATCANHGISHVMNKKEDDLKLCRCWGDTHCSHVWFDQRPGGPSKALQPVFHYQYSGHGASRYASACDGSWEIQIWQCTDNRAGCQTAVAVKFGGVLIETVGGTGSEDPRCFVNGKLSKEAHNLPNGLSFRCPLNVRDVLCVSVKDQFDLSLTKFNWGNQLDQVLFVPKSVCTTEERTICGDPANIGNAEEAHGITIDHKARMNATESIFSAGAVKEIDAWCNGPVDDTPDEPIVDRQPKEICDEKSQTRWASVLAICENLKANHPNFYQDCLLDQCNHLDPNEEEGIEEIAGEEEPVAKCVDAPCNVNPCFSDSVRLAFEQPSQNNLGGNGPDAGAEEMRFSNVATVDGTSIDLVVKALSDYEPFRSSVHGLKGEFGYFNLKPGTEAELEFSFVGPDGAPFTVSDLAFSFLDFDTGKRGQKAESMTVCGVDNVALNEASSIQASSSGGCYTIKATSMGKAADNPVDSNDMNAVQLGRTAAVLLKNRDKFTATFTVGEGKGKTGRAFMFNGKPTVACPQNRKEA